MRLTHIYCLFKHRYFYVVTNLFCNIFSSVSCCCSIEFGMYAFNPLIRYLHMCLYFVWRMRNENCCLKNASKLTNIFFFHLDVHRNVFFLQLFQFFIIWANTHKASEKNPTTWIMSYVLKVILNKMFKKKIYALKSIGNLSESVLLCA